MIALCSNLFLRQTYVHKRLLEGFIADYTHTLMVIFFFLLKQLSKHKGKRKEKGKLSPVATWEEKQQRLLNRSPSVGVLCSATHVPPA